MLLAVPPAAGQQRDADHAAQDDHDDREQRIAHKLRIIIAVQHDGRDAHDLDGRNGKGEHQRSEGLAEDFGDAVGVAGDGQRRTEHHAEKPDENDREAERMRQESKQALAQSCEDRAGRQTDGEKPVVANGMAKPAGAFRFEAFFRGFRNGCAPRKLSQP